jgi:transcriptional regulator
MTVLVWTVRVYVPPAFANDRVDELHDFIEQYSFGVLVSTEQQEPAASHLPFLLDRGTGASGTLIGHFAKDNPQWRELAGQQVLAVFTGPHAYISPTWYQAENTVPTWNYVAVHACGTAEIVDDPAETQAILLNTVERYERGRQPAWSIDAESDFFEKLSQMVIGFRIEITKLEGKWKLNQNHAPERRYKVIAALKALGDPQSDAVAELMAETLPKE